MQSAAPGRMTAGPSSASGAPGEPSEPGEHARALTEILAERIRAGGPFPSPNSCASVSIIPLTATTRARARAGSATTTRASTCIRFSGVCLRGNLRKCGSCSDRLARSSWRSRAPESAAWPATFWISARGRFPNFMRRWNMSPSSAPARAAPSMRRASRTHAAAGRVFERRRNSRARFPPDAFFQMNCWTLCPRTALSWKTARCGKSTWDSRAGDLPK